MGRPHAFDGMTHEFCVKLGWCGCVKDGKPLHVSDLILGDSALYYSLSFASVRNAGRTTRASPAVRNDGGGWERVN
jgi:hypothetical protein